MNSCVSQNFVFHLMKRCSMEHIVVKLLGPAFDFDWTCSWTKFLSYANIFSSKDCPESRINLIILRRYWESLKFKILIISWHFSIWLVSVGTICWTLLDINLFVVIVGKEPTYKIGFMLIRYFNSFMFILYHLINI